MATSIGPGITGAVEHLQMIGTGLEYIVASALVGATTSGIVLGVLLPRLEHPGGLPPASCPPCPPPGPCECLCVLQPGGTVTTG